jgi:hypothetical protein
MSLLDKLISSVTPPESDEKRAEARARAKAAANPGDWLAEVITHHEQLEAYLGEVRDAANAQLRLDALARFERLFAAHSIAEEMVLYPAAAQAGEKITANMSYTEQAAAKMQIAALEVMNPMSADFLDKLGHLEGAVRHHMHEEEDKRFIELLENSSPAETRRITVRYREEFARCMGRDAGPTIRQIAETPGASLTASASSIGGARQEPSTTNWGLPPGQQPAGSTASPELGQDSVGGPGPGSGV